MATAILNTPFFLWCITYNMFTLNEYDVFQFTENTNVQSYFTEYKICHSHLGGGGKSSDKKVNIPKPLRLPSQPRCISQYHPKMYKLHIATFSALH